MVTQNEISNHVQKALNKIETKAKLKALKIDVKGVTHVGRLYKRDVSEFISQWTSEGVYSISDVIAQLKSENWESAELDNVNKQKGKADLCEELRYILAFKMALNKNRTFRTRFKASIGYAKGEELQEFVLGSQFVNVFVITERTQSDEESDEE